MVRALIVLRASDVHIAVGGETIVAGVSLEAAAGACVRVAGPSGSGKTTVLRGLACLMPLAAGQLALAGEAPAAMGYPQWRTQVMYVPQRPVMFDGSTTDNLRRAHGYRHQQTSFDARAAEDMLRALDVGELFKSRRPARDLSGGEQQRLQLARALLLKPRVLLIDEPTSSLGAEHVAMVEGLLQDYLEGGGALLLVTHSEAQATRLANHTVSLAATYAPSGLEGG